MSKLPFRLSDDWNMARVQTEELFRIIYEDRVGGLRTSSSIVSDGDALKVLLGSSNLKVGSLTREMESDSGDIPYGNVGFKPSVVVFLSWLTSAMCVGMDDGANRHYIVAYGTTPGYGNSATNSIGIFEDANKYQLARVKSMDSDGFTLTWTKGSTPATATASVYYLAIR